MQLIYYVSTRSWVRTLGPLLLYFRGDLLDILRFIPYENINLLEKISSGVVIWTDLDRLDVLSRLGKLNLRNAIDIHLALSSAGVFQLNDPEGSLRRFDLMRSLFEAGINEFNVYRLDDVYSVERYPVFIRKESGIATVQPRLYANRDELISELSEKMPNYTDRCDIMIVELARNEPENDGYYRKFGAYCVGDRIYAQHVLFGPTWFVKNTEVTGVKPNLMSEHLDYFERNPHSEELREIFSTAHIDYGRIDYCLVNGRIQVFEINTNPAVLSSIPTIFDAVDSQPYADRHAEAVLKLPGASLGEDLEDPNQREIARCHEALMRSMRRKFRRQRTKLTIKKAWRRALRKVPS